MSNLVFLSLPIVILLLLAVMLFIWIKFLAEPDQRLERIFQALNILTAGLFIAWAVALFYIQAQVPIANAGQMFCYLGLMIWLSQFVTQFHVKPGSLALLPIVVVALLLLLGLVLGLPADIVPQAVRGNFASFHVSLALLGVSLLLGSAVFAVGYLLAHFQMKRKILNHLVNQLPPLEVLHILRRRAVSLSWLVITISLIWAVTWMLAHKSPESIFFKHLLGMSGLWLVISVLLLSDWLKLWRRPHLAAVTLAIVPLVLALVGVGALRIFVGSGL